MKEMENLDVIGKSDFMDSNKILESLKNSFSKLKVKFDQKVEVKFVSTKEMQELNKKHRKVDSPTDVISFPQTSIPGENSILGTIVICEQHMNKVGGSTEELVKHGLLHLLGHDHEVNVEKWEEVAAQINHHML